MPVSKKCAKQIDELVNTIVVCTMIRFRDAELIHAESTSDLHSAHVMVYMRAKIDMWFEREMKAKTQFEKLLGLQ